MSHLFEYEDGKDETILDYIEHCSKEPRYQPESPSISLQIDTADDLQALLFFVFDGIGSTRSQFVEAVKAAHSSEAKELGYAFKHLLKMRADLSAIMIERHPDWARRLGIE